MGNKPSLRSRHLLTNNKPLGHYSGTGLQVESLWLKVKLSWGNFLKARHFQKLKQIKEKGRCSSVDERLGRCEIKVACAIVALTIGAMN